MSRLLISGGIVLAVLLLHYSYVDFRFRHRDGVLWFWLANPAPLLNWASRAAVAGAIVAGLATLFLGPTKIIAYVRDISTLRGSHGPPPVRHQRL